MVKNKIWIASDHRGFALKEDLKSRFPEKNWGDLGVCSSAPVDYPDYAQKLCQKFQKGDKGVLICSTGQGMCMKANRFKHIRAALAWSPQIAELARKHNNANVLCLPGTLIPFDVSAEIFKIFDQTEFEQGRHIQRVEKLSK